MRDEKEVLDAEIYILLPKSASNTSQYVRDSVFAAKELRQELLKDGQKAKVYQSKPPEFDSDKYFCLKLSCNYKDLNIQNDFRQGKQLTGVDSEYFERNKYSAGINPINIEVKAQVMPNGKEFTHADIHKELNKPKEKKSSTLLKMAAHVAQPFIDFKEKKVDKENVENNKQRNKR